MANWGWIQRASGPFTFHVKIYLAIASPFNALGLLLLGSISFFCCFIVMDQCSSSCSPEVPMQVAFEFAQASFLEVGKTWAHCPHCTPQIAWWLCLFQGSWVWCPVFFVDLS